MDKDISLRRKFTFKKNGKKIVFIKKSYESEAHVTAKAAVFGLYYSKYPGLGVEVNILDKYKPDLLMTDDNDHPIFWAECGVVKKEKIRKLFKKYKDTHFVFAKFTKEIRQFSGMVKKEKEKSGHRSIIDIIKIPENPGTFISPDGSIDLRRKDCETITLR